MFGSRIDDLSGCGFGLKLGVRYVLDEGERWVHGHSRVTADARETHETIAISIGISRSW